MQGNESYCVLYSPTYFDLLYLTAYHGFEDPDFGIQQIIFIDSLEPKLPNLAVNIANTRFNIEL